MSRGWALLSAAVLAAIAVSTAGAARPGPVLYLSPLPGAHRVSNRSTIAVRFVHGSPAILAVPERMFEVAGESSGPHAGGAVVSDDGETVIFRPEKPFEPGEAVSVTIRYRGDGPRGETESVDFGFTVSPDRSGPRRRPLSWFRDFLGAAPDGAAPALPQPVSGGETRFESPPGFPPISIDYIDNPGDGYVFLTNFLWRWDPYPPSYLMILKNDGTPYFFRKSPSFALDFRKQNDNLLTYFEFSAYAYIFLDSTYTVTDTCGCGNGYVVDPHDLTVLDNGHVLIMCQDVQTVDMSQVVPGGNPQAKVTGMIYQELDASRNVVFEWRTWDHFDITDAIGVDLTAETIDYVHSNALTLDLDGNWLVSHRHLSEITKIDRATGAIVWRLGGRNNQFRFAGDIDDSTGFHYQHDIHALANGHYLLYDNGNFHSPPFSRAVEYALDLDAQTATLVWQYRETPDIYGWFMGSAQRLPGGNTFISWGGTRDQNAPTITEVRPDGTRAFQLTIGDSTLTYRAHRYPWRGTAAKPVVWQGPFDKRSRTLTLCFDRFGDSDVHHYVVYRGEAGAVPAPWRSTPSGSVYVPGLQSGVVYEFRVRSVDGGGQMSPESDPVTFVYSAEVPPAAALYPNVPNPFNPSTLVRFDMPQRGPVRIVVYDVAGREIKTLVSETRDAGLWQVEWDGSNRNGDRVASGVYFCRLETAGSVVTRKMVLVR